MKKRSNYEMPIGKLTEIPDFLPPPEKLIFPEETVKVTLILKKSSVAFFKKKAFQQHTKYQKMIREVVDRYTKHYERAYV